MPEFYQDCASRYQPAVQPHLDAIARGVRDSPEVRALLVQDTAFAEDFVDARPLWLEQWRRRDPANRNLSPFWSNYWYEPCATCTCRIPGSKSMEVDALFFVRAAAGARLAIHVEMKRDFENPSPGQAEAYRPRAACFQAGGRPRKTLLEHDHHLSVLFCGAGTDLALASSHFDRVITHRQAGERIPGDPTARKV